MEMENLKEEYEKGKIVRYWKLTAWGGSNTYREVII